MAMHYFQLSPSQQSAAGQIYTGFYNYAIGQGADAAGAQEFGYLGVGVASGEGLGKTNVWGTNPDNGVTALGPFQLNLNGGIGSDFGLSANSSPSAQINAAASTMWGQSGTDGSYNTGPWNAVGDTTGPGGGSGNDTAAGQSAAIAIGQRFDQNYGFSGNPAAPSPPEDASGNLIGAQNPSDQTLSFPQDEGLATDFAGGSYPSANYASGLTPLSSSGVMNAAFGNSPLTQMGLGSMASPLLAQLGLGSTASSALAGGGQSSSASGGQSSSASGGQSSSGGGGIPIQITNAATVGQQAGQETQQGLKQLGQNVTKTGQAADTTLTQATASVTKTGTGWLQYLGNLVYDVIPRGGVGIIAIILIGLGIWLFGKQGETE